MSKGKHQIDLGPMGNDSKKSRGDSAASISGLEDLMHSEDVWRNTLLPLLDPIDLIRLMHTNKASRRIAAPILNRIEAGSIHTKAHTEMFRSFLRNPRVTRGSEVWAALKNPEDDMTVIPGPLRLQAIADRASDIEKRFAILSYKKSYDKEESLVVFFDGNGAFIGQYVFSCNQFYEDYNTKHGVDNMSTPKIKLNYSGGGDWRGPLNDRKLRTPLEAQTEYYWQEGWCGDLLDPHIALIDSFAGLLSPTEAMFVLMHALCSDTRVIYVMTVSFFYYLNSDFDMDDDDEPRLREFRQKLSQFSYTTEENQG